MTATLYKLRESTTASKALKVDRENGIIHDPKILGLESNNIGAVIGVRGEGADKPYLYDIEAIRKAAPLYENLKVNLNHPDRTQPGADRAVKDRFGRLEGIYVTESGMYAERLRYLKTHEMAEPIAEAAESIPDLFCLSHNADGDVEIREGRAVVTEIFNPLSVDIVSDGGTTSTIFESSARTRTMSRKTRKTTLKRILESFPKRTRNRTVHVLREQLEDGVLAPEMPVEVPVEILDPETAVVEEATPEDGVKAAFSAAIMEIFADDSLSLEATIVRIAEMIKAHETVVTGTPAEVEIEVTVEGGEGEGEGTGEGEGEGTGHLGTANGGTANGGTSNGEKKPTIESLSREVRVMRNEKKVAQLLESEGRLATSAQVSALAKLSAKERATMVDTLPLASHRGERPHSSPPLRESRSNENVQVPTDAKKFAAQLK